MKNWLNIKSQIYPLFIYKIILKVNSKNIKGIAVFKITNCVQKK